VIQPPPKHQIVLVEHRRLAAHIGQVSPCEEMLESPHEFAPDVDKFTDQSPAPVLADANGTCPQPEPGVKQDREY